MSKALDTRAIGLDVGLAFTKWLTGAENLHYGLWDGLEVTAGNLRAAQDAYTDKLFALLPKGPLRILDIGGGAGETARKLLDLGHEVEIVVPSAYLADRCRENAPAAKIHEMMFEEHEPQGTFDLCLFSESFQYNPFDIALSKTTTALKPGGQIVIADCFRAEGYKLDKTVAKVGGGHRIERFRKHLSTTDLNVVSETDITQSVAPSVELEQDLFNVLGYAHSRVTDELALKRPKLLKVGQWVVRRLLSERRRQRLDQRVNGRTRTAEAFCTHNVYLLMVLETPR